MNRYNDTQDAGERVIQSLRDEIKARRDEEPRRWAPLTTQVRHLSVARQLRAYEGMRDWR